MTTHSIGTKKENLNSIQILFNCLSPTSVTQLGVVIYDMKGAEKPIGSAVTAMIDQTRRMRLADQSSASVPRIKARRSFKDKDPSEGRCKQTAREIASLLRNPSAFSHKKSAKRKTKAIKRQKLGFGSSSVACATKKHTTSDRISASHTLAERLANMRRHLQWLQQKCLSRRHLHWLQQKCLSSVKVINIFDVFQNHTAAKPGLTAGPCVGKPERNTVQERKYKIGSQMRFDAFSRKAFGNYYARTVIHKDNGVRLDTEVLQKKLRYVFYSCFSVFIHIKT
ncbi:unnamed protein product [Thlaspi arvense]|uniref:Uncharacterized protein n=1 Tax=Thlaspi arvense TaxID=13288 RepID=A0AAU9RHT5_THLAR|nr:unnamed protein product [Thlaspi arvense]